MMASTRQPLQREYDRQADWVMSKVSARRVGYAVSIVKAGARIAGIDCGPVRLPLLDLAVDEEERLAALMQSCGLPVARATQAA